MGLPATTKDLFREGATVTLDLCTDAWGTPVLFVSTRTSAAHQLEARLGGPGDEVFHITHVPRWQAALEALEAQEFAAVLLDAEALDVDPGRAYALLRKVAKATPAFTVADEAPEAGHSHVVPRHSLDRRGLLRRIRARSVRRSSVVHLPADAPTRADPPALGDVLAALRAGRPTRALRLQLEALVSARGVDPKALVASVVAVAPNGEPLPAAALDRALTAADAHLELWRWLLETALERFAGRSPPRLVLPLKLGAGDHGPTLEALSDALSGSEVSPRSVQVTLTEPEVMREPEAARIWAAELGLIGVSVALSRVGAATSSFEVLARLHPARLELDPRLVAQLHASAQARLAVEAIAATARVLGATASAAGVDVDIQAELLEELGYRLLRGGWRDDGR